ncbi:DMT family transporter [uncultured Cocleimonas sp.]|uniref:DMT family transporter n=1 Tax=uncultured Cocleimonas sp. TaxID=1051587 RepID=UPI002632E2DC|nr:DMT family transporter [uncultured Cocleimonas sp.]
MSNKFKGTLFVLICVALWALIPVVAKLGQASLDNHQFLFWSSLVSLIVLSITAVIKGDMSELGSYSLKEWLYYAFLGLLGTYIYYLFLYLGYAKAVGMEVLVIQYTWPIFILVLSLFILKEQLTIRKTIAIALGFVGVMLVLTKGEFENVQLNNLTVISLVAAGSFCFALFSVLSKNIKRRAPLVVISIYFLSATLASLISMLYFSEFAIPSSAEIMPILLNGIFVNGFSYLFWLMALRSAEASYLAPFTFITPVLSAIYLIVFFDEPMLGIYLVGLACVIVGGLVNSLGASKKA